MADTRIFDNLKCEGGIPYAALGIKCPKCGATSHENCPYVGSNTPPPLSGEGSVGTQPIDIILFCPRCGLQHIDAPDERTPDWTNPPHKSHLCHGCGFVFRPADVPTNGVADIKTIGANDGPRYRNRATLPAQEVGWQGMESAPKDQIIDLWATCSANTDDGYQRYPAARWRTSHLGSAWTNHNGTVFLRPTHWRPLPAPPESTLRTGEDG